MFSKPSLVFVAAIYFLAPQGAISQVQQPGGWVDLPAGQTAHGIRYAEDGKVWNDSNLVATCRPDQASVHVSSPSAIRKIAALICKSTTGDFDKAYIVDTKRKHSTSLNVGSLGVGIWVSWSPDENFALFDLGVEGGLPHMFLVDLRTHLKKEIRFKQFDRSNETQGFNPDSLSWIDDKSFSLRLDIYGPDNKVNRSYPAQVDLSPFRISYAKIDQVRSRGPQSHRKTGLSSKPKTFSINRECDGGLCHFEIVSFNYSRTLSISVGRGDSSLSYYFSVQITNGSVSKDYVYSDAPERHFVEKESGQRVDSTLNRLLLDVYDLGNYIAVRDVAIRNRRFSETGRFAVLASLRTYF